MKVKSFVYNMFGVNTFVVWNEQTKDAAIIDPGMISNDDFKQVESFIEENDLNVVHLVNTHLHIDHTLGNKYISERYGLGV